jgi:hypothetical protein
VGDVGNASGSARDVAELLLPMIAGGWLNEGNHIPDEAELMLHSGVDPSVIRAVIDILGVKESSR